MWRYSAESGTDDHDRTIEEMLRQHIHLCCDDAPRII